MKLRISQHLHLQGAADCNLSPFFILLHMVPRAQKTSAMYFYYLSGLDKYGEYFDLKTIPYSFFFLPVMGICPITGELSV